MSKKNCSLTINLVNEFVQRRPLVEFTCKKEPAFGQTGKNKIKQTDRQKHFVIKTHEQHPCQLHRTCRVYVGLIGLLNEDFSPNIIYSQYFEREHISFLF